MYLGLHQVAVIGQTDKFTMAVAFKTSALASNLLLMLLTSWSIIFILDDGNLLSFPASSTSSYMSTSETEESLDPSLLRSRAKQSNYTISTSTSTNTKHKKVRRDIAEAEQGKEQNILLTKLLFLFS